MLITYDWYGFMEKQTFIGEHTGKVPLLNMHFHAGNSVGTDTLNDLQKSLSDPLQ